MAWATQHRSGSKIRKRHSHCAACGKDCTGKKAGERRGTRFICRECTARWTFGLLGIVVERASGRPRADVAGREGD
jgi:hypothetical protein